MWRFVGGFPVKSAYMRRLFAIFLIALLRTVTWADAPTGGAPGSLCGDPVAGLPACNAPSKDLKLAKEAFARGVKLQSARKLEEAFSKFEDAARLLPHNVEYVTAREILRQQLV